MGLPRGRPPGVQRPGQAAEARVDRRVRGAVRELSQVPMSQGLLPLVSPGTITRAQSPTLALAFALHHALALDEPIDEPMQPAAPGNPAN